MEALKKQQAVVYVDTTKLFFYPGLGGSIAQVTFPNDLVIDLEILNTQKFIDLITSFFQVQKIPPSEILFIFSPATVFEKEFSIEAKKEDIQAFLDYVPFDAILSKSFSTNKGNHVYAINGQMYVILKQAFEKCGCVCIGAAPYAAIANVIPELVQKINLPLMLTKFDTCRGFSLESIDAEESMPLEDVPAVKKDNKRLFLLVGVFGVLIFVMVIMLFTTFHSSPTNQQPLTPKSLPVNVSPIVTEMPSTAPSSVSASPKNL